LFSGYFKKDRTVHSLRNYAQKSGAIPQQPTHVTCGGGTEVRLAASSAYFSAYFSAIMVFHSIFPFR
jgi:hypothetical protein